MSNQAIHWPSIPPTLYWAPRSSIKSTPTSVTFSERSEADSNKPILGSICHSGFSPFEPARVLNWAFQ